MPDFFMFTQFEFTHAIGPRPGRYVVASLDNLAEDGSAPRSGRISRKQELAGATMEKGSADVLTINVVEAPPMKWGLRRKAKQEAGFEKGAIEDVSLLLASFVRGSTPIDSEKKARGIIDDVFKSNETQEAWVADGLRVLNAAVRAYRSGARDPYVTEIAQRDARYVRIGYGDQDDVANGRWREAMRVPPASGSKATRVEKLAPSERIGHVLAGRDTVLEAEDMMLRCYADLDHGRLRAAAMQLDAATELLRVELTERGEAEGYDLDELHARAERSAKQALDGDPEGAVDVMEGVFTSFENVIDRWRYDSTEAARA